MLSQAPILSVVSAQYAIAGAFPLTFQPIPVDRVAIDQSLIGQFGSSINGAAAEGAYTISVAPGFLSWAAGRNGYYLEVTYINGWPHTSTTADVSVGDTLILVDDVTGFAGAVARWYDGGNTEGIAVTSVTADDAGLAAPSGPGTLTLAQGTQFGHESGTMISTLPANILQAATLFAVSDALLRGGTATTIQALPGTSEGGGGKAPDDYRAEAEIMLAPYRRIN